MNKKGYALSEAGFLAWRLSLIFVLALVIVFSLTAIFSAKQDIRPAENVLLAKQIMDCIGEKGIINANFNLGNCFASEENYANVTLVSFDSGFNKSQAVGKNLGFYCKLESEEQPVSCFEQKYYALIDKDGELEKGMIDLLIATAKYSENVR